MPDNVSQLTVAVLGGLMFGFSRVFKSARILGDNFCFFEGYIFFGERRIFQPWIFLFYCGEIKSPFLEQAPSPVRKQPGGRLEMKGYIPQNRVKLISCVSSGVAPLPPGVAIGPSGLHPGDVGAHPSHVPQPLAC